MAIEDTINEVLTILRSWKKAAQNTLVARDVLESGELPEAEVLERTELPKMEELPIEELPIEELPIEETEEIFLLPDDEEELRKAIEELGDAE